MTNVFIPWPDVPESPQKDLLFATCVTLKETVGNNTFVAGGAVLRAFRGETGGDIDIYTELGNSHTLSALMNRFVGRSHRVVQNTAGLEVASQPYFTSKEADSYRAAFGDRKVDIQIIKMDLGDCTTALRSFDFHECALMARYDGLWASARGLLGITAGKLTVQTITNPSRTARRIIKYARRGLVPDNDTMDALMKACGRDVEKEVKKYK